MKQRNAEPHPFFWKCGMSCTVIEADVKVACAAFRQWLEVSMAVQPDVPMSLTEHGQHALHSEMITSQPQSS